MENKLKAKHSYLIRNQRPGLVSIPIVEKITVVSLTQTCYEIQWENQKTWEEISVFDPRIMVVEDLGEQRTANQKTWKELEEELKKLRRQKPISPNEDKWPLTPHRYPPWESPWYYPRYPEWWKITCR